MDHWDEVRTAYHVALAGTVSGAAEALGVHHATVIRHVDALETRLGVKLFQRHARGYTATEAGSDLLRVARATDDQFAQLAGRIRGRGEDVSGDLVVTALESATGLLAPLLAEFQLAHPGLQVQLVGSSRVFRLEYGEAHVAVRASHEPPSEPDNVVQKLMEIETGIYASSSYLARKGRPQSPGDLAGHDFVGSAEGESRPPYMAWLKQALPDARIVFGVNGSAAQMAAVRAGVGIGFLARRSAADHAELVELWPPEAAWQARLWLVTHMDLHRTAKVQGLVRFLKARLSSPGKGAL